MKGLRILRPLVTPRHAETKKRWSRQRGLLGSCVKIAVRYC